MQASELIEFLQDFVERHGDYEVLTLCFDVDGDAIHTPLDRDEIIVHHDSEEIFF